MFYQLLRIACLLLLYTYRLDAFTAYVLPVAVLVYEPELVRVFTPGVLAKERCEMLIQRKADMARAVGRHNDAQLALIRANGSATVQRRRG